MLFKSIDFWKWLSRNTSVLRDFDPVGKATLNASIISQQNSCSSGTALLEKLFNILGNCFFFIATS